MHFYPSLSDKLEFRSKAARFNGITILHMAFARAPNEKAIIVENDNKAVFKEKDTRPRIFSKFK